PHPPQGRACCNFDSIYSLKPFALFPPRLPKDRRALPHPLHRRELIRLTSGYDELSDKHSLLDRPQLAFLQK
ncbi:MAG: hypothetical protein NWR99_11805, partial [Verrucomicrobiales bacterium]|nr:hypothetical protein [Verrucomicrobiales bacterium]